MRMETDGFKGYIHYKQLKSNKNTKAALEALELHVKRIEAQKFLNVALTRAKSLLYVIGNWGDWRRHPFFDVLSEELPVAGEDCQSSGNSRSENSRCLRPSGLFRPTDDRSGPWPASEY